MPPKSASKKDQINWYMCEKCKMYLTSKHRDKHNDDCPTVDSFTETDRFNYPFIKDQQFFLTNLCEKTDSTGNVPDELLTDLGPKYLNNLVFANESVMSLCDWILSDFIILQSKNHEPVVRRVWPTAEKNVSSVFVTKEELENTWKGFNSAISMKKLSYEPPPAAEIRIIPIDPSELSPDMCPDLSKVITKELFNNVVCDKTSFSIEFFNKKFHFSIKQITGRDYSDIYEGIEAQLSKLDLNQTKPNFHLVTRKTRFEIVQREDPGRNNEDSVSVNELQSIGGLDDVINDIRDSMNLAFGIMKPMAGIQMARAVLLYGLPGVGKSLLCNALATQSGALIIKVNASEIFSKYFGETEANLISHFDKAFKNYPKQSFVIIEEVVNVCAKENKEDSSKRVNSAFLNILDSIHSKKEGSRTFVLATTSNIENINPAVRRSGRFDVEIEIPVPNPSAREQILTKILANIENTLTPNDVKYLAGTCHGFVGADLSSLISKSVMNAINKQKQSSPYAQPVLTFDDIKQSLCYVKPSAMREVLIESPNVKWTDIGGQDELKLQLKQAIEWPLTHPETFTRLGITPPRGILMFGPPGCSKTMIAKALATESKVNFLSIKGPELFSMWVGESERAVRDLFRKARQVAPAIIFFDEIDAIGGERSTGSSVKERVLAQMLTEMDGVNVLSNVTIVAATNRPDLIDKALMRPGRIDRIVYVKLPDEKTRAEIFKIKMRSMPIAEDVNLNLLVSSTEGYSGAEVQAVCQEAAMKALEDNIDAVIVSWQHFMKALQIVQPRTNADVLKLYEDYLKNY